MTESGMRCGLLGRKLGHSFSPLIHGMLASYDYRLFEREPGEADDFLRNGPYDAINVTIPYKENAYRVCDVLSPEAEAIGAVNTVVRKDGRLRGYNTDWYGFREMLRKTGGEPAGKKCLILGSGGSAKTVSYTLRLMGAASVTVISRSGADNYENLYERHGDAEMIINTTPKGMFPNSGEEALIEIGRFPRCVYVGDLIFNPAMTRLLYEAKQRGIRTSEGYGLYMLVQQAVKACELFTGRPRAPEAGDLVFRRVREQTQNLILIGMPGCGKTSVGLALAERMGRRFADVDRVIEEREGCTIPEIFAGRGEEAFRRIETEVTAELGRQSGLVISTGGGVVTRPENYFSLACNGRICYLKRPVEGLPTGGRPVSQSRGNAALYEERRALYEGWCDFSVDSVSEAPPPAEETEREREARKAKIIGARAERVYEMWCREHERKEK